MQLGALLGAQWSRDGDNRAIGHEFVGEALHGHGVLEAHERYEVPEARIVRDLDTLALMVGKRHDRSQRVRQGAVQ